MELTEEFWNQRYLEKSMGWDLGQVSPPLKDYIDQLENKELDILIPGAGSSYEAEYLYLKGFLNTTIIDLSPEAIRRFIERVPNFPNRHAITGDFFELSGQYDLILEQTFFCAIDKKLRPAYAKQMKELLRPGGKLVGLMFDDTLYEDHPPFGGSPEEYKTYFKQFFNIEVMEPAYNSIGPRAGTELWVKMVKK